jgi:hypothetical protein
LCGFSLAPEHVAQAGSNQSQAADLKESAPHQPGMWQRNVRNSAHSGMPPAADNKDDAQPVL